MARNAAGAAYQPRNSKQIARSSRRPYAAEGTVLTSAEVRRTVAGLLARELPGEGAEIRAPPLAARSDDFLRAHMEFSTFAIPPRNDPLAHRLGQQLAVPVLCGSRLAPPGGNGKNGERVSPPRGGGR